MTLVSNANCLNANGIIGGSNYFDFASTQRFYLAPTYIYHYIRSLGLSSRFFMNLTISHRYRVFAGNIGPLLTKFGMVWKVSTVR